MFSVGPIRINISVFVFLVTAACLVTALSGCAIDKQFSGFKVANKTIESGAERVAVRVVACVNPQGSVLCERKYGAMTECSLMCRIPPNQWRERPVGYGGYEDRKYTRYILTLQSPSGVIDRIEATRENYERLSIGQVIGEVPANLISDVPPESKQLEAESSVAPLTQPDTAALPAQAASASPVDAMTVAEAQRELVRHGFNPGQVDGVAGARTSRALLAFQKARRIPMSGQLDAATVEELRR